MIPYILRRFSFEDIYPIYMIQQNQVFYNLSVPNLSIQQGLREQLMVMRVSVSKQSSTRLALTIHSIFHQHVGCAQLHITPFRVQEAFLHSKAGCRSTEHLRPICVPIQLLGTGTVAGTNHWSSDPGCCC